MVVEIANGLVKVEDEKYQLQHQAAETINPSAITKSGIEIKASVEGKHDLIMESEEYDTIKTTSEELEAVVLFSNWPRKKVYIRSNLSPEQNIS